MNADQYASNPQRGLSNYPNEAAQLAATTASDEIIKALTAIVEDSSILSGRLITLKEKLLGSEPVAVSTKDKPDPRRFQGQIGEIEHLINTTYETLQVIRYNVIKLEQL